MKHLICLVTVVSFAFLACAMQDSFEDGHRTALRTNTDTQQKMESSSLQDIVPQFHDGFVIKQGELANTLAHLEGSEYGKDLQHIHKTRTPYILDDTESFMTRSEKVLETPTEEFTNTEVIEDDTGEYTIETCEECPNEEYFVKARRTKNYLVAITASKECPSVGHGVLRIKVEIDSIPTALLMKGGPFNDVTYVRSDNIGAYTYETYKVDGYDVRLKKTIEQENRPGIRPDCYLVASLNQHVLAPRDLINHLLGLKFMDYIYWGEIGEARVHPIKHQYYFILDDRGARYESLVEQGVCRYEHITELENKDRYSIEEVTYACQSDCRNTCAELKARGCSRDPSPECVEQADGRCIKWRWQFKCRDRIVGKKHSFSKENPFCLGGDCIDGAYESDREMLHAVGVLSILEAARKEYSGAVSKDISVFNGHVHSCSFHTNTANFKDCCTRSGWGTKIRLASCNANEKTLSNLRNEGKCIYIGTHCVEKVPLTGICIRKKKFFCCFSSRFAKLLQEQGKHQLGIMFGSAPEPNCRGFTPEELSRIDFSKLDFTEITHDIMDKFKPVPGTHFAKDTELHRIRAQMQKVQKGHGSTEQQYLQENMKHLTSSVEGGR